MSEELKYYKTSGQNNYGWNLTWEATGRFPIIAKRAFTTLANAQYFVDNDGTSCEGLILAVFNDPKKTNNGIYVVQKVKTSAVDTPGILLRIGSGFGITTTINYSKAKELAGTDNIGQIIYTTANEIIYTYTEEGVEKTFSDSSAVRSEKNEETGVVTYYDDKDVVIFRSNLDSITSTVEYTSGPFIVTGEGTVSKLGTTTASGDLAGDVESLKGSVSVLESDVDTLENKVKNIEDTHLVKDIKAGQTSIVNNGLVNVDTTITEDSTSLNPVTHKAIAEKFKAVENTISLIPRFDVKVVESIDSIVEPSNTTIYLVPLSSADETNKNVYVEYIYVSGKWEMLGEHKLDLSEYYTKNEIDQTLEGYVEVETGKSLVANEKITLIDTNAEDISDLKEVLGSKGAEGTGLLKEVETIGSDLNTLEDTAVTSATGDAYIILSKDTKNSIKGALNIGTFVDDVNTQENGVATVEKVSAFVQREIESAFAWVDVVEEED